MPAAVASLAAYAAVVWVLAAWLGWWFGLVVAAVALALWLLSWTTEADGDT